MRQHIYTILISIIIGLFSVSHAINAMQSERTDQQQSQDQVEPEHHSTPTVRVKPADYPSFTDDLRMRNMKLALDRQIARFKKKNLSGKIRFGKTDYPKRALLTGLQIFRDRVESAEACYELARTDRDSDACAEDFDTWVKETYDVYRPKVTDEQPKSFFTAYYTPLLMGTSEPTAENKYPVYRRPGSARMVRSTREQIDFDNVLAGQGLEFGFFNDRYDLYMLHIQGGGRIMLTDQQKWFYISYDGTNRQAFRWISTYMKEKGYIDDLSVEAQRTFLDANPDKHREIYSVCASYVYFKITDTPPHGSDLVALTDFRSIATDSKLYKEKGGLAFIKARRPVPGEGDEVNWVPFSRFYLNQDTGGAIKGAARADLYFGEGRQGEYVATKMKEYGDMYFLMPKRDRLR